MVIGEKLSSNILDGAEGHIWCIERGVCERLLTLQSAHVLSALGAAEVEAAGCAGA